MEFLKKCLPSYGSPLNMMYTLQYVESCNNSANKHAFTAFLLAGFKNRYVNALFYTHSRRDSRIIPPAQGIKLSL